MAKQDLQTPMSERAAEPSVDWKPKYRTGIQFPEFPLVTGSDRRAP